MIVIMLGLELTSETMLYLGITFILSGVLIVDNIDFEKSFKLSILTITNTTTSEMFGIQNMNFANLLTSSKLSLIIFMIIGKIELISVLLIIKKLIFKS